jgi:hypothetical protein
MSQGVGHEGQRFFVFAASCISDFSGGFSSLINIVSVLYGPLLGSNFLRLKINHSGVLQH